MQEESIFHLKAPFSPTGDQPQAIEQAGGGHPARETRARRCWA